MQPLSRSCGGEFSAIYLREITDVSNMFQNGCKFAVFPEEKKTAQQCCTEIARLEVAALHEKHRREVRVATKVAKRI